MVSANTDVASASPIAVTPVHTAAASAAAASATSVSNAPISAGTAASVAAACAASASAAAHEANLRAIRIAITTGEPAGIGPELMYDLTCQDPHTLALHARIAHTSQNMRAPAASDDVSAPQDKVVELVLIGNKALLQERMEIQRQAYLKRGQTVPNFVLHDFDPMHPVATGPDASGIGHISILDLPLATKVEPGKLNPANAAYVLNILDKAIAGIKEKTFAAMVTGPIAKSVMVAGGLANFTGHTEYLQEQFNAPEVVMMLGCAAMNVALVTTHLPLKDISAAITKDKLRHIITILHHDLKTRMGFSDPKIFVCGLNPHAGESGVLGHEEIDTIIPVLEELRAPALSSQSATDAIAPAEIQGMDLHGPYPADTIFQKKYLDEAAAILAMYHDQGLPVLKYVGFDSGYNTTLGLPCIRTSVDHGTALDLAATGQGDAGSLLNAVSLALYMVRQEQRYQQQ